MQNQLTQIQLHKFRAASELKKEAKGGYLEGTIKVPDDNFEQNFPDLKLELFTPKKEPHTHLVFITTNQRQKAVNGKKDSNIVPKSCYIILRYKDGKYRLETENHPYLPEDFTLPDKFWDSVNKEIKIGSDGLRITVTKAGIKGKSEVPIDEMKQIRGIAAATEVDPAKVCLGLSVFQENINDWRFDQLSNVILDKSKYDFEIDDVSPPTICEKGSHPILVVFKHGNLTCDFTKKLTIFDLQENQLLPTITNCQIIPPRVLKFPIELNGLIRPQITYLDLKIQDKDGIEIFHSHNNLLKIKSHDEDDAFCECQLIKKSEWTNNKRKTPSGSSSSGFSGQNSPTDSAFNSDDAAKKPKVDQNAGFEDIQVSAEDFTLFDENLSLESLFGSIQNSDLIAADGLITNLESGSKNNLTKPTPTSNHSPYRSHVPGYYSFWDIFTVRFLFSLFILLLAIWYF